MRSPVNVFAMADVEDGDGPQAVIDLANDAVSTAADSVAVAASEFFCSVRAGIGSERLDIGLDAKPVFLGQLRQFLHGPAKDGESVAHLRRRSSSFACLKGIALLREALAAS